MKIRNLMGHSFGRLQVIDHSTDTSRPGVRWICMCRCGKLTDVRGIDLTCGKVRSCGCMRKDDLTGQKFGRWTFVSPTEEKTSSGHALWNLVCDCGTEGVRDALVVTRGQSKSCGCLRRETDGQASVTHGHSRVGQATPTYRSWVAMRSRCNDANSADFKDYGGRGITVCSRWDSFENFLTDMGERSKGQTIERQDPNGNYEPGNCCWATRKEQSRNRRDTVYLTRNGETKSLADWADLLGLKQITIHMRLRRGYSDEEALTVGQLRKGPRPR